MNRPAAAGALKYQFLRRLGRHAGQSVVQFARRIDGTGLAPYAVKFYLMRSVYQEEVDMYRNSPAKLKRFMPRVVKYVANEDSTIVDPFGNTLPPFIVMEKGESLRDRTRDNPVDMFTAAQVLSASDPAFLCFSVAAQVWASNTVAMSTVSKTALSHDLQSLEEPHWRGGDVLKG